MRNCMAFIFSWRIRRKSALDAMSFAAQRIIRVQHVEAAGNSGDKSLNTFERTKGNYASLGPEAGLIFSGLP
jgi:hypothetical protein